MNIEIMNNIYVLYAVVLYIIVYGIAFGVRNWINRTFAVFTQRSVIQNSLGKTLDALWLVLVVMLVLHQGYIEIK